MTVNFNSNDAYDFDEDDIDELIDLSDLDEEIDTGRFSELNFNNPTRFNSEDFKYFLNCGEE